MSGTLLLTGATGFVGSHVAEALHAEGHELRCTVRGDSSLRWIGHLPVDTVEADLREPSALRRALAGVDRVVHVAGVTVAARPGLYRTVNLEATERLAREAAGAGVERFVFVSSLAARGPTGAEGPVSAYGRSKRAAEVALADLDRAMKVVVLRPGGVYGPRDDDLLPLFRSAARGWLPVPSAGAPLQPVYATDAAEAVVAALAPDIGYGPWPVVEPGRYGWDEVAAGLSEALGRRVRSVPVPGLLAEAAGALAEAAGRVTGRAPIFDLRRARDLVRHRWTADPASAAEGLGWKARVALPEGLARTAEWYREVGWL